MIAQVNLALSNRCNAKCIWCPTSRGTKHNFDMETELVHKIVDEIKDDKDRIFKELKTIHISENGEAVYHKDFLDILRYIRKQIPHIQINFLSNFALMSRKLSTAIVKENLIDTVGVNIDGHDEASYRAVKKISFKSVIKQLKTFIELHTEYQSQIKIDIMVMPAVEYATTVKLYSGKNPDQVKEGEAVAYSNFDLTRTMLREFCPDYIEIHHSKPGLWSERSLAKQGLLGVAKKSQLTCPQLERLKIQSYIAPNGDWYACCLDDNNDLVLGNLYDQTMGEIYYSMKRIEFIQKLEQGRFMEIGHPCSSVEACQVISIKREQFEKIDKENSLQKEVVFE